jgi:hypothetical protein
MSKGVSWLVVVLMIGVMANATSLHDVQHAGANHILYRKGAGPPRAGGGANHILYRKGAGPPAGGGGTPGFGGRGAGAGGWQPFPYGQPPPPRGGPYYE